MAWIKKAYLYVVSLVSLIIIVVAAIMLVNMGLKQWVFTKADTSYYYPPCTPMAAQQNPKDIACDTAAQQAQQEQDAKNRSAQKQRDAAQAVSMIIVAAPVFWYHWKLARKEA